MLLKLNKILSTDTKRCCHCKQVKPLSEFHRTSASKDGYKCTCKDCVREYNKKYVAKKAAEKSNEYISKKITNNVTSDIFDVMNLKDLPANVKKGVKIPKNLIKKPTMKKRDSRFAIRSQITNVLRLMPNECHITQIAVAYYRMFKSYIPTRKLSMDLMKISKNDKNLSRTRKGYYVYNNPDKK